MLAFVSPLRWVRFARMAAGQRSLLVEAAVRLASAAARARLVPFQRAIQSAAGPLGPARRCDAEAIATAVHWASAVLPIRAVCLQQGLACQAVLRSRGLDARLHYGAALGQRLEAHVWVTVGDRVVIGEEEAARFRSVACFPA